MKKIILCLGLTAVLMLSFSCKEKTTETIETNTTTVDTDTVMVHDTDTVVVPETEGTSVKIDSNGVDIKSKTTKVEVKK